MTNTRKGAKTQRLSIRGSLTRAWLLLTFLSSLFTLPAFSKPNVITIITDDQGWADIGYNNPGKVYTPNLDALAAESALCTRHYSMPQCTPTRIAAFTGRYPGRFGNAGLAASNEPALPPRHAQPRHFSQSQRLPDLPLRQMAHGSLPSPTVPTTTALTPPTVPSPVRSAIMTTATALARCEEITWHRDGKIIEGYENGKHVTDLVSDEARSRPQLQSERARDRRAVSGECKRLPFFLYLAYHAPHTPLDERGDFVDTPTQLDPDNPKRWLNEDKIKWFNDPKGIIQSEPDPEKRLFLAVIYHLDHGIGQVIKALDESGQRDNTLILFSSDNGPQVNWPGNAYPDDLKLTDFNQKIPFRGKKCDAYEGGIRVPGFVHWRGKIPARKVDSPVHVVDWLPTIAGFIGAKLPPADDGAKTRSSGEVQAPPADDGAKTKSSGEVQALPPLDGQNNSALYLTKADPPTRVIYQLWGRPGKRWALSYGDWKLVHYGKKEPKESDWHLYDLGKDEKESKNLAKKHPEKVKQLHQLFVKERAKDRKTKSNL